MKRLIMVFLFITGTAVYTAEKQNLITNQELTNKMAGGYCNSQNFKAEKEGEKNIVVITGNKPPKGFQRIIQGINGIKPEDLKDAEVTLSFKIKIIKLSGSVTFAVREANEQKSLRYNEIKLTKYDQHDWKEYTNTFKLYPITTILGLYITADYLEAEDVVMFSDLKIVLNEPVK
jgi:hypothetical protein